MISPQAKARWMLAACCALFACTPAVAGNQHVELAALQDRVAAAGIATTTAIWIAIDEKLANPHRA